jgi:hypothetical protein
LKFSNVADPLQKETLSRSDSLNSLESEPGGASPQKLSTEPRGRSLDTIGTFGWAVLIGGTAVLLAVLALLIFLWSPAFGADRVTESSPLWRWLSLSGARPLAVLQTITVLTAVARLAAAAQATLGTSLLAAVVLESNAGVPLFRVPEFSVMRSASSGRGPLRLAWLLVKSCARPLDGVFAGLAILLLALSVALQFSSTILISDLGSMTISGYPREGTAGFAISQEAGQMAAMRQQTSRSWLESAPAVMVPFGEMKALPTNMSPSGFGVSDTGVLRRVFLPLRQDGEAPLRGFRGGGFAMDSRYVCMPPVLNATISVSPATGAPAANTMPFYSNISGSINYGTTFAMAGLGFDSSCLSGSCFAPTFDCTIPSLIPQQMGNGVNGTQAYGLCILPSTTIATRSIPAGDENSTIPATSKVLLLSRNNGNWLNWSYQNNAMQGQPRQGLVGTIQVPSMDANPTQDGEWTKLQLENGVILEYSLCFQQLAVSVTEIDVSRDIDNSISSNGGQGRMGMIDTSAARNMLGAMPDAEATRNRGIFVMNPVGDSSDTVSNTTDYFLNRLLLTDQTASGQSVSVIMHPMATSYSSIDADVEYQSLFADIMDTTNRPGLALRSLMTAAMGSLVNNAVDSNMMDNTQAVTIIPSADVLAPTRLAGLAVVVALLFLHMLCVACIAAQFLMQTRYSGRGKGNHWQTIAQVVSVGTKKTLEGAVERTDKEIGAMLGNGDIRVRIGRCPYTGRVTVVPLDLDCLQEWKAQVDAGALRG